MTLGLDPLRTLDSLSSNERRLLCAWRVAGHAGVEAVDGESDTTFGDPIPAGAEMLWRRGFEQCVERFVPCKIPLGEIELVEVDRQLLGVDADRCLGAWMTAFPRGLVPPDDVIAPRDNVATDAFDAS